MTEDGDFLEPSDDPAVEPTHETDYGLPWGGIIATLGVVLLVIFAVQNTETVDVDFLWLTGAFPLSIVILVTAVSAGLLTMISGAFYRRQRRRRRQERDELRRLREED